MITRRTRDQKVSSNVVQHMTKATSFVDGFDCILDVTFADSLDVMRKIYRDSCIQYIAIYVRIYVCIFSVQILQ